MYFSSTVQFKEVSGAEDKAEKAATWPVHPRVALSPQEPRRTCLASSRQARRSVLLRRCPLCDSGRLPGALGTKRPPVPWGNTRRPRLSDCERRQRERPGAASPQQAASPSAHGPRWGTREHLLRCPRPIGEMQGAETAHEGTGSAILAQFSIGDVGGGWRGEREEEAEARLRPITDARTRFAGLRHLGRHGTPSGEGASRQRLPPRSSPPPKAFGGEQHPTRAPCPGRGSYNP